MLVSQFWSWGNWARIDCRSVAFCTSKPSSLATSNPKLPKSFFTLKTVSILHFKQNWNAARKREIHPSHPELFSKDSCDKALDLHTTLLQVLSREKGSSVSFFLSSPLPRLQYSFQKLVFGFEFSQLFWRYFFLSFLDFLQFLHCILQLTNHIGMPLLFLIRISFGLGFCLSSGCFCYGCGSSFRCHEANHCQGNHHTEQKHAFPKAQKATDLTHTLSQEFTEHKTTLSLGNKTQGTRNIINTITKNKKLHSRPEDNASPDVGKEKLSSNESLHGQPLVTWSGFEVKWK